MTSRLSVEDVVARLGLAPHPEGGFYRETFRDATLCQDGRAASTAIYFLLPMGAVSHWHRVDAAEMWHYYAGASLRLSLAGADGHVRAHRLGPDLAKGEEPQCLVPKGVWQMAEPLPGDAQEDLLWSLVGCTVAPGFRFSGFELAPPGWRPDYTAS